MTEEEKSKKLLGIISEEKTEKVLNLEEYEDKLDYEELYKLKEYDNFRKLLISMKDKNFPYVSYLEGGFEAFHQECLNYKIELVEHTPKICKLCKIDVNWGGVVARPTYLPFLIQITNTEY
jgi:hypothetical protein